MAKGLELSCSYTARPQQTNPAAVTVTERLQQLEALVLSFMRQQPQQQQPHLQEGANLWQTPARSSITPTIPSTRSTSSDNADDGASWPEPAEHGKMRENSHGANYVSSVHWAAVLDSISELIDQCDEKEKEKKAASDGGPVHSQIPGPRLLYEPVKATKTDILTSMPTRPVVDRMVARYFNALGIAPGTTLCLMSALKVGWC